jgi:hypothetical protein
LLVRLTLRRKLALLSYLLCSPWWLSHSLLVVQLLSQEMYCLQEIDLHILIPLLHSQPIYPWGSDSSRCGYGAFF